MSAPTLIIAGITLPVLAHLDFQQTFDPIGGNTKRRMAGGALFSMTNWRRWKTTISGSGWIPAQLLSINFDEPYEVHSIQPVAFAVGAPLPPGWAIRTDFPGTTITDEAGIETRLIYPVLTVMSDPPRLVTGSDPTWELSCEEV